MTNSALLTIERNDDARFRQVLAESIKRSALSREQIASRMSSLLGKQVTVNQLNQWTAISHDAWRMPASYVRSFCEATGDSRLQRFLLGSKLVTLLELGEEVSRVLPALISRHRKQHNLRAASVGAQNDLF